MQCLCQPQNRLHITRCTSDLRCIEESHRPASQSACGISPSQLWDAPRRLEDVSSRVAKTRRDLTVQTLGSNVPSVINSAIGRSFAFAQDETVQRGRRSKACAPRPASRFVSTSDPPCASAIWRLNGRPIPEPSGFVVKNGTKRFAGFMMPGPSS
jgi:hypothetical protein